MWVLGGGLAASLIIGVPIAFALAAAAGAYALFVIGVPSATIAARLFSGVDSFILMAVPLFVLTGTLMNECGITDRLIAFVRAFLWWMYASLAQVNVAVSMVFGGMTGIATADTAAVGPVMIPAMSRDGYKAEYATALTMTSSLLGPIIPPSIPMLIYAVTAGQSVGAMFLAGAVPGVLLGLGLMVFNVAMLKRQRYAPVAEVERPSARFLFKAASHALLALMMPVIIIGGIVGGVVTPTEAAGLAVFYAIVIAALVYRTLTPRTLAKALFDSALVSSAILLIVTAADLVGWVLTFAGVPQAVGSAMTEGIASATIFLLVVIVIAIMAGFFLETTSSIIILAPLLLPAATAFGISPIHFGVVLVIGLIIGLMTPPVGLVLFVGSQVSGISIERLSVAVIPFLSLLISFLLLITFVPALATALPEWWAANR